MFHNQGRLSAGLFHWGEEMCVGSMGIEAVWRVISANPGLDVLSDVNVLGMNLTLQLYVYLLSDQAGGEAAIRTVCKMLTCTL